MPTGRGDAPRGLFTPRWVELQQTYGIERSQGLIFFVWMLHGSTSPLSGRSPFCQLQISEKVAKTLDVKYQVKQQIQKQKRKNTNHKAVSQRVQGEGEGGLFLGRLDQGLIGNAESTHVIRPKGKALHLFQSKGGAAISRRLK